MTDDDDVELDLDLDLARFNTGDTSDAEAAAMIDCWQGRRRSVSAARPRDAGHGTVSA